MFAATLPATPADTPYDTTIYSIEYSGASDFPQYSGNTFADLNAVDGYVDLHPYLLPGWPAYFDPSTVANAVPENVSTGLATPTTTSFPRRICRYWTDCTGSAGHRRMPT